MFRPIFGQDDAKHLAARIAQTLQRAHDAARGDTLGFYDINHTFDRPSDQCRVGQAKHWRAVDDHMIIFPPSVSIRRCRWSLDSNSAALGGCGPADMKSLLAIGERCR